MSHLGYDNHQVNQSYSELIAVQEWNRRAHAWVEYIVLPSFPQTKITKSVKRR